MSNENLPQGTSAAAAAGSGAVGNDRVKFDGKAAIASAFAGGKAFIPFVTCGDPDLATTEELVCAMADAGASLIELGIPFSDPTAEGPSRRPTFARFPAA